MEPEVTGGALVEEESQVCASLVGRESATGEKKAGKHS